MPVATWARRGQRLQQAQAAAATVDTEAETRARERARWSAFTEGGSGLDRQTREGLHVLCESLERDADLHFLGRFVTQQQILAGG